MVFFVVFDVKCSSNAYITVEEYREIIVHMYVLLFKRLVGKNNIKNTHAVVGAMQRVLGGYQVSRRMMSRLIIISAFHFRIKSCPKRSRLGLRMFSISTRTVSVNFSARCRVYLVVPRVDY